MNWNETEQVPPMIAITVVTFGKITESKQVDNVNTEVTIKFALFENSGFFITNVKNWLRQGL